MTEKLDWEVELCIVMGKEAREVSKEEAMDYVFGFTAAHDVSARDWQLERHDLLSDNLQSYNKTFHHRNGGQWLLGKAMKAFAPIGPAIVTKDVIGDPNSLDLSCKVNGEIKQVC